MRWAQYSGATVASLQKASRQRLARGAVFILLGEGRESLLELCSVSVVSTYIVQHER